ncbi:retention module-containing protein [Pseudomonas nicosulfuronedens]
MSSVVAVVKSIIGQVIAVTPEGAQRVLVEGDRIYQGEQLLTGASGAVTLDVGKGKLVDLGRDSQWSSADLPQAEASHAATQPSNAPSTEDLQKAIAAGLDPTQALAPTAAGPSAAPSSAGNGGVGGGHSFVVLDATGGRVDPNIGYTTAGLDNGGAGAGERQGELPPNLAPQFIDGGNGGGNGVLNLTTAEDTLLTGAFSARDPNGDLISYSVGQSPANGLLVLNPNGTWQYNPNGDYNGVDGFTVIVTDSRGASSTLVVNVGITPVNDAPVATGTHTSAITDTATNDSFADIKGQLTATDVDDTHLTWSGSAKGTYGELIVNADGSYTYVVDANTVNALPLGQNPSESFTVTVTDPSGATDTRVITINVQGANDTPVAQDGQASGNEDSVIGGQLEATDRDSGSTLTFTGNGTPPAGFTLKPDGSWTFDGKDPAYQHLAEGETLVVQVPYTVTDEHGATSTATLTVTLTGTNDAPVALPDAATTEENTVLNGQVPAASDIDGNVTGYQLATDLGQGNGNLTFNPDGSYSFNPGKDFDSLAQGETRDVTFTYQAKDNNGALSDPQTVTITVTGSNDAAVIAGQTTGSADETDTPVSLNGKLSISDVDSPATFQAQTNSAGTYGKFSVGTDGSWTYSANDAYNELKLGEHLTDSFTVLAADGTSTTVTVTINGTNDAPVASADVATTDENSVLNGQVPTASDIDGTVVGYQLATDVAQGKGSLTFNGNGSYTFTPGTDFDHLAAGASEIVTFTYQAKDNNGALSDPQTITITVTGSNDAPIAYADSATTEENSVLNAQVPAASDVDGSIVGYQLTSGVGNNNGSLTFNPNGSYSFNPGKDFDSLADGESRDVTFTYQAQDNNGALSDPQTITITITGSNDAPVASATSGAVKEDAQISGQLAATDADNGAKLSYALDKTAPAGFSVDANGKWSFDTSGSEYQHLKAGATQTLSIPFTVTDEHGATSSSSLTITITGTNDAPVANAASASGTEDKLSIGKLVGTDVDDGAKLSFSLNDKAPAGFTLFKDGTWAFSGLNPAYQSLAAGETKVLSIDYTVTDEHGATSTNTLTLTVTGTNDTPIALPSLLNGVKEDAQISGQLKAIDVDNGAQLTYSLNKAAPAGLTLGSDGKWSFDASDAAYQHLKAGATQLISVGYTVTDEHGASTQSVLVITVTGTNDAPKADAATAATKEDAASKGQLTATDVDDGAKLSFSVSGNPPAGFTLKTDGSWTFDGKNPAYQSLAEDETQDIQVKYIVTDEHGATDTQTLTITVTGTNDPAVIGGVASVRVDETDAPISTSGQLTVSDVDGAASFQAQSNVTGQHGTFNLGTDGAWTYTANDAYNELKAGEELTDSFVVKAADGTSSTVTVTLVGTNDAPVAYADVAKTAINVGLNNIDVLGNDTDVEKDGLSVTNATLQNPAQGNVSINADGTLNFVPGSNVSGPVVITYEISDGHGGTHSSTLVVNVGANTAPEGTDSHETIDEDSTHSFSAADFGFTDADAGQQLQAVRIDSLPGAGSLTFNGNPVTAGSVIAVGDLANLHYTPDANDNGAPYASFTFSVQDSTGEFSATPNTYVFDVTPMDDPSVLVADTDSALEDHDAIGNVLTNDHDIDSTLSVASFTIQGVNGSFTAGATATIVGVGDFTLNDDGSYRFTPVKDWNGDVPQVTYTTNTGSSTTLDINIAPVQDAPVANDDHLTIAEDTPLVLDTHTLNTLTGNDTDADGDSLTVYMVGNATHGSLEYRGGQLVFTPEANYSGPASFTYWITDGQGNIASATVNITVTPTDDPSVLGTDTGSAQEDHTATGNVLSNDSDVDNTLSVASFTLAGVSGTFTAGAIVTLAGKGEFTLAADGQYSFTPVKDWNGDVPQITYTTNTGSSTTLDISITPVNDAPVANDDHFATAEDTPLTFSLSDLTGNDFDVDGDRINVVSISGTTHGTLAIVGGQLVFTPDANYHGDASFTYTISDGHGGSASGTAYITITPVNDNPVAVDDSANVREDQSVTIDVLQNDSDVDGDPLTVTGASAGNGSVVINQDGTLSYTPKANFSGTDTITYQVSDGHGGTSSATVNVTIEAVADKPDLNLDASASHPKATGLNVDTWTGLALGNGGNGAAPADLQAKIDAAGTPGTHGSTDSVRNTDVTAGTATKVSGLIFLEAGHTYTFSGVGDDSVRLVVGGSTVAEATWGGSSGKFSGTFTPSESGYYPIAFYQHNQNGPGSYTLSLSDNGSAAQVLGTGSAQVFHDVSELTAGGERLSDLSSSGQSHYKVFGLNEGNEDTAINLSKVKAALVDTDGSETLSVSIGKIPAGATLSDGTNTFTADATHDSINLKGWNLDTLTLTPPADFNGTIQLEVSATATESSNNDAATRTVDLNVTVYPVNDAPTVSAAQNLNTDEDTPVAGQIHARDVDGDSLTYALKNGSGPAHGSVSFGSDGHYTYTPAANYNGSDSFTVVVSDGHGGSVEQLVTVGIAPVNDLPVFDAPINTSTPEDTPLNSRVTATDVDGDSLSFSLKSAPTHGSLVLNSNGSYTYTPAANYNGTDSFTVTVNDGKGGLVDQVVSLSVTPVNDAPTTSNQPNSTPEDTAVTGKIVASDVDGDTLGYAVKAGFAPAHGSVTVNATTGDYTYTPSKDYNGSDSFTVRVSDGKGGFADSVVNITVTPVNDAPTTADQSKSTAEDTAVSGKIIASDVDGDTLGYAVKAGFTPAHGSVTVNATTGDYTYTPGKDYNGSDSFTVTVSDGKGGFVDSVVSINVTPVNDAPEAKNDSKSTGENSSVSGQVPVATDIDSAVNGNGYALVSGPSAGTLTFNANGSYVYNPGTAFDSLNVGESRQVTFTYTAKDVQGAISAPATVTITINGENDAPTGANNTVSLNEDGSRSFSAADFGFSDKDSGDALKAIRLDNLPTAGSLTLNGQSVTAGQVIAVSLLASLVYTPIANAAGAAYATLKFSVQDSHDSFSSSSNSLTFTVNAVNDAPLSADGSASLYAGKTYTFSLKDFAFSDTTDSANGQNHSLQNVIIKALPDSGSLLLNGIAVKAGQPVAASDVAGGKLTFVPDASGANAHFSFAVQDSGGVANGGGDTSPTYGFDLHVGQVQIPVTTPNGDNTLTGGSGDDVILGDVGGLLNNTQPGTNYNIALVVDTSGSMAYNLTGANGAAYADSRMKLVKDALINLANTLKGHDGVINISLIGFSGTASIKVSVADLNSGNVDQLITAIGKTQYAGLQADGGTDYQAAFEQAVSWFNGQKNGYENLTLFLTDGNPTESRNDNNGQNTTYTVVKDSVEAFANLSALGEVHAIGIGTSVNENLLKFFDNSNLTGTGSLNFGTTSSTSTLFDFNNGSVAGWTLSSVGSGNGTTAPNSWSLFNGWQGEMKMVDSNGNAAPTQAISPGFSVASGASATFSFDFDKSMNNRDTFVWKLEKLVSGNWTTVSESGTLTFQSDSTTITTKPVGEGTYRFDFILTDNSNGSGNNSSATVYIDNIKQTTSTTVVVEGPTGEVDIVKQASDLTAALHGGSSSTELAPSGSDTIHGGAGDDILFGDAINTDNLPWGVNGNPAKPADLPAGSGVSALSAFLELKNGHAATSDEMYNYIKGNHTLFNVDGDTRGGSDHLYGGDGNDILYGQGGNDFLFGENGNDILIGGTGDDQLTGGKGNDILTGGAGADLFIWKAGDIGNDTITDFKASEGDRIDISDLLPDTAHNDILSYLKVDTATATLQVSTTGQINNGGAADVTIKLSGMDLSAYGSTSTEIVNKLVAGADPVVKTEHH